jgi:hypothetical protein
MKRRVRPRVCAIGLIMATWFVGQVLAQTADDRGPDDAIESFLAEKGLDTLLATHLRDRLSSTTGEERQGVAERLGDLYARLHADAATPEERGTVSMSWP